MKRLGYGLMIAIFLSCLMSQTILAKDREFQEFTKLQLTGGLTMSGNSSGRTMGVLAYNSYYPVRLRLNYQTATINGYASDWGVPTHEVSSSFSGFGFDLGYGQTFFQKQVTLYGWLNMMGFNGKEMGMTGGLEYHLSDQISLYAEKRFIFYGSPLGMDDNSKLFLGVNYGWTFWYEKNRKDNYRYDEKLGTNVMSDEKHWAAAKIKGENLQAGLTKEEVLRMWGTPYSQENHGDYSLWDYYDVQKVWMPGILRRLLNKWDIEVDGYTLYFEGDTLVDWSYYDYQF